MIKEIALHEIEDGDQFIGVWTVRGTLWSDTFIKKGGSYYVYKKYNESGLIDDFECDTRSVERHVRVHVFKAYVLETGAIQCK